MQITTILLIFSVASLVAGMFFHYKGGVLRNNYVPVTWPVPSLTTKHLSALAYGLAGVILAAALMFRFQGSEFETIIVACWIIEFILGVICYGQAVYVTLVRTRRKQKEKDKQNFFRVYVFLGRASLCWIVFFINLVFEWPYIIYFAT